MLYLPHTKFILTFLCPHSVFSYHCLNTYYDVTVVFSLAQCVALGSNHSQIRMKRAWVIKSFAMEEESPGPFPYILGTVSTIFLLEHSAKKELYCARIIGQTGNGMKGDCGTQVKVSHCTVTVNGLLGFFSCKNTLILIELSVRSLLDFTLMCILHLYIHTL